MQQRQSTVSQFVTQSVATSQTSAQNAPLLLDAATLKLVAGGAQTSGPYGGWASAVASGPYGGW